MAALAINSWLLSVRVTTLVVVNTVAPASCAAGSAIAAASALVTRVDLAVMASYGSFGALSRRSVFKIWPVMSP